MSNVPVIDWEREFLNFQAALEGNLRNGLTTASDLGPILGLSLTMRWTAMQSRLYKEVAYIKRRCE